MEKSLVPEIFIGFGLLISPLSPTADMHSAARLRLQTDARASEYFTDVPHCCDTKNWYYLIDAQALRRNHLVIFNKNLKYRGPTGQVPGTVNCV